MFAHADRGVEAPDGDARQEAATLLLGAVGQQPGSDLPVGDPVRADRGAVGEQFLGHDVAVQVAGAVGRRPAAVLDGDRQADEAGLGEPDAEVDVPARQPAVDGRCPPERLAIGRQELPDRRPQPGEVGVVGAQCIEFAHCTSN